MALFASAPPINTPAICPTMGSAEPAIHPTVPPIVVAVVFATFLSSFRHPGGYGTGQGHW